MSSAYHPHTGLGYCPNIELLQFMSLATSGAYLQLAPRLDSLACWFKITNMYPTTHPPLVQDRTERALPVRYEHLPRGIPGLELPQVSGRGEGVPTPRGLGQGSVQVMIMMMMIVMMMMICSGREDSLR